ncbi:AbfB domain-containing protein [Saccharothrix variisporea]|uniref:AbfB domain-containing protein n=1 Tax=Saccharothrix variisporea TaxID=543527 RepID=UPI000EAC3C6D|nr:AbfB domain-containing protein [Saccharothrix variisporea]
MRTRQHGSRKGNRNDATTGIMGARSTSLQPGSFTRYSGAIGDLAAATWTKVGRQSYTAPLNGKHYLRHYAFVLRVDPIATATDRADATFHVGY